MRVNSPTRIFAPDYDPASDPHNGKGKPMPYFPDTTGKVVTLAKGIVVTDIGLSEYGLRNCVDANGRVYEVLSRVIYELPITYRRENINPGENRKVSKND